MPLIGTIFEERRVNKTLSFNTVYSELKCPYCDSAIESGVGFRVGALESRSYHLGDQLNWNGKDCRPKQRPQDGCLRTVGYFNCDNPKCSSWSDCYPEVQSALIVVTDDRITEVSVYNGVSSEEKFEILNGSEIG
jgi:hypothetical protein